MGPLLITELRPMSEAEIGVSCLFYLTDINTTFVGYRMSNDCEIALEGRGIYESGQFSGWIPFPIYQPKPK